MACFTEVAEMIAVSRTFAGCDAARDWTKREVIPNVDRFYRREILEQSDWYAKSDVNWLSWVVH